MADARANDDFLRISQDFFNLCVSHSWPDDTTQPEEIRSVLLTAEYIEKALIKLTEIHCIDQFLTSLKSNNLSSNNLSSSFSQKLKTDPPKYILKKIIISDAHVHLIDVAMKEFRSIFFEERLVNSLAEIMVESASEETLLRNMQTELPKHKVVEYRTKLLLHEVGSVSKDDIVDEIKNGEQELIDSLVKCMVEVSQNAKYKDYGTAVTKIEEAFVEILSSREASLTFLGALSKVDKIDLIDICLKYDKICEKLLAVLKDNCNLLKKPDKIMFKLNEFVSVCKTFWANEILKLKLTDFMKVYDYDVSMWNFLS